MELDEAKDAKSTSCIGVPMTEDELTVGEPDEAPTELALSFLEEIQCSEQESSFLSRFMVLDKIHITL